MADELKERIDQLYQEAHFIFKHAYQFALHQLLNSSQPLIDSIRKSIASQKTSLFYINQGLTLSNKQRSQNPLPQSGQTHKQTQSMHNQPPLPSLQQIQNSLQSVKQKAQVLKRYSQGQQCRTDFHKYLRQMFNKQINAQLSSQNTYLSAGTTGISTTFIPQSVNSSCILSSLSTQLPKQSSTPYLTIFDAVQNQLVLFNLQKRKIQERIEIFGQDFDLAQGFQSTNIPQKGLLITGGRRLAKNLNTCYLISLKEEYALDDSSIISTNNIFSPAPGQDSSLPYKTKKKLNYHITCKQMANMLHYRSQHALAVLQDQYIFAVGAYRSIEAAREVQRFSSDKNIWQRYGQLNIPRWGAAIVALQNMQVYVIAGYDCTQVCKINSIQYVDTIGMGDSAKRWRILQYNNTGCSPDNPLSTSDGWTARANCGAMQLCFDKILIFGGEDDNDGSQLDDCFLLETHTFRIDKMNTKLSTPDTFSANACSSNDNGLSAIAGGGGGVLRSGSKFYTVSSQLSKVHWMNMDSMKWNHFQIVDGINSNEDC